ncbi:MAG TPA: DnaJ domain-containing protein, partial [Candidatus Limnocylindrales bacterium]|nr:DnaJ domain-containing protein [Candidatus Limnocylindrales bacterium]
MTSRESVPRFDLYGELEVPASASAETIEAAYRSLVKRYHPDVLEASGSADPQADERIKRINLAREWLSDPERRRRYDQSVRRRESRGSAGSARSAAGAGTGAWTTTAPPSAGTGPAPSRSSFGPNTTAVRAFLGELRQLDDARALQVRDAKATIDPDDYAHAKRAAFAISRVHRLSEWLFARDAATTAVREQLGETKLGTEVAELLADVAGAIAAKDLLPGVVFDTLHEPWAWQGKPIPAKTPPPPPRPIVLSTTPRPTASRPAAAGPTPTGPQPSRQIRMPPPTTGPIPVRTVRPAPTSASPNVPRPSFISRLLRPEERATEPAAPMPDAIAPKPAPIAPKPASAPFTPTRETPPLTISWAPPTVAPAPPPPPAAFEPLPSPQTSAPKPSPGPATSPTRAPLPPMPPLPPVPPLPALELGRYRRPAIGLLSASLVVLIAVATLFGTGILGGHTFTGGVAGIQATGPAASPPNGAQASPSTPSPAPTPVASEPAIPPELLAKLQHSAWSTIGKLRADAANGLVSAAQRLLGDSAPGLRLSGLSRATFPTVDPSAISVEPAAGGTGYVATAGSDTLTSIDGTHWTFDYGERPLGHYGASAEHDLFWVEPRGQHDIDLTITSV